MKKLKIFGLLLLALLVLVSSFLIYGIYLNPKSPRDTVTLNKEELMLEVDYSRPYKKDRLIFGSKEDGALVPYSNYWRLGANFATTFETNQEISFFIVCVFFKYNKRPLQWWSKFLK